MQWFIAVLKNYATFTGRARRQEYWMYMLFFIIFYVVLAVVDGVIGTNGILAGIYALALLVPSIAVCARRLHDTGRSGWWQLIQLIPLLGAIVLLIFLVQDSNPGENTYGPNPKEA